MKIKEKYYPVNNQEDEDGYSLYPGSAMIYEDEEFGQEINADTNLANTGSGLENFKARNFILSNSDMLR